jgi:transposase
VWNLGLEQRSTWVRWKGPTPGLAEQNRQLTAARAAEPWLAAGSVTVQQQALRDLDQAWRNFVGGTHDRPTWRKKGRHEGFRVVGAQALRVRQDSGKWSSALVPKVGWVRFKRSQALPDWKSYRVTRDRAGRWHLALVAVPEPIPAPGTGEIVGVDRGVTVAVALSSGELSSPGRLHPKETERLLRLERQLARAQRGSGRRSEVKTAIARMKAREADRRERLGREDQHRPGPTIRRDPRRRPQRPGHDPLGQGDRRRARPARTPEGRTEPGHPRRGLDPTGRTPGTKGSRTGRESQPCVHPTSADGRCT